MLVHIYRGPPSKPLRSMVSLILYNHKSSKFDLSGWPNIANLHTNVHTCKSKNTCAHKQRCGYRYWMRFLTGGDTRYTPTVPTFRLSALLGLVVYVFMAYVCVCMHTHMCMDVIANPYVRISRYYWRLRTFQRKVLSCICIHVCSPIMYMYSCM